MLCEASSCFQASEPGPQRMGQRMAPSGARTLKLVSFAQLYDDLVAKHAHANTLDVRSIVVVHDTNLEIHRDLQAQKVLKL